MASAQSCRPACEQQQQTSCNVKINHQNVDKHHHLQSGQKMADMTSRAFKRDRAHNTNKAHCSQTVTSSTTTSTHSSSTESFFSKVHFGSPTTATTGHGGFTAGVNHNHGVKSTATTANGGRKSSRGGGGHKKKGLFERINDRIAGRSDDSGGSSSSSGESDSDDDNKNKNKNKCAPKKA